MKTSTSIIQREITARTVIYSYLWFAIIRITSKLLYILEEYKESFIYVEEEIKQFLYWVIYDSSKISNSSSGLSSSL